MRDMGTCGYHGLYPCGFVLHVVCNSIVMGSYSRWFCVYVLSTYSVYVWVYILLMILATVEDIRVYIKTLHVRCPFIDTVDI